jgi:hypothetical protein
MMPDLHVQIVDSLAEGDKVTVRTSRPAPTGTGQRMEMHVFVLQRLANGKIVERWTSVVGDPSAPAVAPLRELSTQTVQWRRALPHRRNVTDGPPGQRRRHRAFDLGRQVWRSSSHIQLNPVQGALKIERMTPAESVEACEAAVGAEPHRVVLKRIGG